MPGVMAQPTESSGDRARRRGQRLGIALFATFVAGFTLLWPCQILSQVFGAAGAPEPECRKALLDLLAAVERARVEAVEADEEREALSRFRRTLEPAWSARASLDAACADDAAARRALPEVDEFRYAEEHAVRRDFHLSRDRQRARELYRQLSGPDQSRGR